HGRGDLRGSFVAILLAYAPAEGDEGVLARTLELVESETAVPAGDHSLRGLISELQGMRKYIDADAAQLKRGVRALNRDIDDTAARFRLGQILDGLISAIEDQRRTRLIERPIDPARLNEIRREVEAAIFTPPAKIPFFEGFIIERVEGPIVPSEIATCSVQGVPKGELTQPPMDSSASLKEHLASCVADYAAGRVLGSFARLKRRIRKVKSGLHTNRFWQTVSNQAKHVVAPVLLVPHHEHTRLLRSLVYESSKRLHGLNVEQKRPHPGAGYLATIEGVDVYSGGLKAGEAWLFSARALRRVAYLAQEEPASVVSVIFQAAEDLVKGTVKFEFSQSVDWDGSPIIEFKFPDEVREASARPATN
ncbi:MAG: hypothetical protein ACRD2L_20520, partial [Terriglobia bacterium]